MAKAKHINDTVSDLPEGFKMTELGPLPEEWEVVRLGEVAKFINGFAFGPEHWAETGRPIIRIQNLTGLSQKFNYFNGGINKKYIVIKGDLLVSWSASIDVFMWNGDEAWLNQHIFKVTDYSTKVSKDFLFFALKHRINQIKDKTHGSTMKHITRKEFLAIPIPLPPLSEQKAIAYVLQTVQRAKEATEKVIQATQELKKSLMRHLFTYGPVPVDEVDKVQLKETEIGLVPEHWEVVRLGDIFEIQQGKALSPKHRMGKSPFPFLRTANILWGQIDLSVVDEMDFTDEEVQRFKLLPGDLLVCEGGDIGRTAIWRGELSVCCYQNHIHRLRSKNQEIEAEFYMYWMQAAILLFSLYLGQENKTTIPNLSKSRLATFAVPFPSLLEQRAIARVLQAVDKKLQVEKIRKQALEILFQSLLHNLMTGKLRVKDTIFHEIKEE